MFRRLYMYLCGIGRIMFGCLWTQGKLQECTLSSHLVGPRDRTQDIRLGNQALYLLSSAEYFRVDTRTPSHLLFQLPEGICYFILCPGAFALESMCISSVCTQTVVCIRTNLYLVFVS